MKKIILSMKPGWMEYVMSGEKIYEYRTRFPDDEIEAYLYVSRPDCVITGKIILGRKILLDEWLDKYSTHPEVLDRINAYIKRGNKVVMPIISYQTTNALSREYLEEKIGKFTVPQSFYYVKEGTRLFEVLEKEIIPTSGWNYNVFSDKCLDEICRKYK
ncbi:hypothetical protein [Kandleria vitulina]|uniref:hypothetical protein n=1 Tax=Kandleria vitulina TaxID=1630 RepID=UPI0012D34547|nr:hypothetical protein [Kandleria vitulina]